MGTTHRIIFGDCRDMHEIPNESIHLMVTSPPYYNAPFDYPCLFQDYNEYLTMLRDFGKELRRKIAPGRVAAFVTDDMLVDGEKYPVVADTTRIMLESGFRYRDKIVWVKPKGYIRISRRSGVLLQHPYPMYFYPDNIQETILLFQKGRFDYGYVKQLSPEVKEASKIDLGMFSKDEWYLTVWNTFDKGILPDIFGITNVLPTAGRIEAGVAAFPEEIPTRLIRLFTFVGETVLDPFLGSGTTMKAAAMLKRNSWGYELDKELKEIILNKVGYHSAALTGDTVGYVERSESRSMRTRLQDIIRTQRSATE